MFICAEAGSTHRGNVDTAMGLATAAKEAGADAIKFIASNPAQLIADMSIGYEGQRLFDVIESFRFASKEDWHRLAFHCNDIGLEWFVSLGTIDYLGLMEHLDCPRYKIGGWDARNKYLMEAVASTGKPVIIDIGPVIGGEVFNILNEHFTHPSHDVTLVYESHSAKPEEMNLMGISYLRDMFGRKVGFSSDGISSAPDAVAQDLGLDYIEKRIRAAGAEGQHHENKALDPEQFADWVQARRNHTSCEIAQRDVMLGKYGLYPSAKDVEGKQSFFTSLVWHSNLPEGTVITKEHLVARRPGHGISPYYDYLLLGKTLARTVSHNEVITYEDIGGLV